MSSEIVIPEAEMPDWIKRARRGTDRGMLIVIVLSLLISWAFILYTGVPANNASENYVFQTTDVAAALHEGRLYPRWSPHAQQGYGAPVLHYYPPGAAYTAALIDVIFTGDTILAVRISYGLALLMAGALTYVLVLQHSDALSALLAAILYLFSPVIGLTLPHLVGDLPGVFGAALLPGFLWALSRLLYRYHAGDIIFTALFCAAIMYTAPRHMIPALLFGILLAGNYLRTGGALRQIFISGMVILTGILLAAPYWLPAWLEAGAVRWQTASPSHLNITHGLSDLLAPAQPVDPAAMLPQIQSALGLPLLLLIPVTTFMLLRHPGKRYQLQQIALSFGIGLLVFLSVAETGFEWLLPALMLSFAIAGSSILKIRFRLKGLQQRLFTMSILIAATLLAMPVWLSSNPGSGVQDVSPQAQISYEQQGFGIASLPPYLPLPTTLHESLPPNRQLIDAYASRNLDINRNINRFSIDNQLRSLVNQLSQLEESTHAHTIQINRLPQATDITLLLASFPGWQATLNDLPVPLTIESGGLLRVSLPVIEEAVQPETEENELLEPRTNELQIYLGSTPARQLAWTLCFAAALLLIIVTRRHWRRQPELPVQDLHLLNPQNSRLIVVLFTLMAVGVTVLNSNIGDNQLQISPYYQMQGSTALRYRTGTGLEAFAYKLANNTLETGDTLDLTVYWQTRRFLSENYQVRLHLREVTTGQIRTSTEIRAPGFYPTRRWRSNLYVRDEYAIDIADTFEPGRYAIVLEVIDCTPNCQQGERVQFFDEKGRDTGTFPTLPLLIEVINTR